MAVLAKGLASFLAGATFFGISMLSASAQEGFGVSVGGVDVGIDDNGGNGLGVGVSVGGPNGVNADVGLGAGGSGGLNASVDATVGGSRGIDADVDVGALGGGSGGLADVDATASIGGSGGVNVGAGANVGGGGVDLDVSVGIGGTGTTLPGVDERLQPPPVPGRTITIDPDTGGTTGRGGSSTAIAGMSDAEVARFARRCADILGNPGSYDSDLVGLCRTIRAAN